MFGRSVCKINRKSEDGFHAVKDCVFIIMDQVAFLETLKLQIYGKIPNTEVTSRKHQLLLI